MRYSQEVDYAMRFILVLAEPDKKLDASTISKCQNVTIKFTHKILRKLTEKGITLSIRGKHGGYKLARHVSKITLCDVIETIDGPIAIAKCVLDERYCNKNAADACPMHQCINWVSESLRAQLDSITFEDVLNYDYKHFENVLKEIS